MVNLRPLELADLPRFAELERELFGVGAWSPAMIAEEVNGYGRWYVVATAPNAVGPDAAAPDAAKVVGYAGLWYDGDVTQVMNIGVDPNYHRQGIGKTLLQALIAQSEALHAHEMFLEVAVDNQPAINLYREFGFTPLAIRKRYYQPGNIDAYTMRLQLP